MPPLLMDELVEEIVLRIPPDEPASLIRAALVCKGWCRLISSPRFHRRFREFHRAAPLLGFLCNLCHYDDIIITRFVPASSSSFPPHADRNGVALDARHGRVLLYTARAAEEDEYELVVWNPITDERRYLPASLWCKVSPAWTAAVLCAGAGAGACDHHPFLVVVVGTIIHNVFVLVYSSETDAWSEPTLCYLGHPLADWCYDFWGPSLLVGDTLHFTVEDGRRIFRFDVSTGAMDVVTVVWNHRMRNIGLVTGEDGGLGAAGVDGYHLYLWSPSVVSADGVWTWKLGRVIELDMMLSIDIGVPSTEFLVAGFAQGANTMFIRGSDGIYAVALETGQVTKVHQIANLSSIIPYVNFYTPDVARSVLPACSTPVRRQ